MTISKKDTLALARAWAPPAAGDDIVEAMAPGCGEALEAASYVVGTYPEPQQMAPMHVMASVLTYIIGMKKAHAEPEEDEFVDAVRRMYVVVRGMFTSEIKPAASSLLGPDGKPLN